PVLGTETTYPVRLVEPALGSCSVDSVGMVVVDRSPTEESFITSSGIAAGARHVAYAVKDAGGSSVLSDILTSTGLSGHRGDALLVRLKENGSRSDRVRGILRLAPSGTVNAADTLGLLVQEPAGAGWATRAHIHPRRAFDDFVVDSLPTDSVRL